MALQNLNKQTFETKYNSIKLKFLIKNVFSNFINIEKLATKFEKTVTTKGSFYVNFNFAVSVTHS
jgi:transcriptional regulator